jgi:hypothetical protein
MKDGKRGKKGRQSQESEINGSDQWLYSLLRERERVRLEIFIAKVVRWRKVRPITWSMETVNVF